MEFAVIKTGGKQYIVSPGQKIKIEKLEIEEGGECLFKEVLLHKNGDDVTIGAPLIQSLKVKGKVLRQEKDKKVVVFKYKPKKRYKVKGGHRQSYTEVEIIAINFSTNK